MSFRLSIMTPEAQLLDDQVEAIVLPGADGFFGVLAHHAPMVVILKPGVLRISQQARVSSYVVGNGVAEVGGDRALILTETALEAASVQDAEVKLEEYLKERARRPLVSAGSVEE